MPSSVNGRFRRIPFFDADMVVQKMTISYGVEQQSCDGASIGLGTFRFRDVLVSGRLMSLGEPSTMFVRSVLRRLTSFGKPLKIFLVSVFDEDMVLQARTVSSGVEQQCRNGVGFSLRTFQ